MKPFPKPNIVDVCPACGAPVPRRASDQSGQQRKYCSDPCRQRASNERRNRLARRRYAEDESYREQALAYQREWRNARSASARRETGLRRHGLTPTTFDDRLASQGGCAICGRTDRAWHVDHDHACCPGTKSCGECVRGILCDLCNKGLGQFKDNVVALRRAAEYLESAWR